MIKPKITLVVENIRITDYAAEGKSLVRQEGKVIFVAGAIPGDTVDIQIGKNKKDWAEGRAIRIVEPAPDRLEPFCRHFGVCGGCKWQMLPYEKQLQYKQQEAEQNLLRIGKIDLPPGLPILGSAKTKAYRKVGLCCLWGEFSQSLQTIALPSPSQFASQTVMQSCILPGHPQ